ncbi:amidophosphoribosyltransferase [Clostridium sp. P21]|uniref:Amidophosphoribosyltransferase n=1 Tax=Clostridium muellerianum TaxID=2716538 RepID=A0A7Y0ELM6_9CLOT|nr:amidophosphoribosyltransferase [Clostridium muellerianum]NMM65739.1 amidophosphoribosyltransferase [Clostridium muellerianum]
MCTLKKIKEDKLKEACGVFGIFSSNSIPLGNIMYYGLSALQHRGQESAGIAISNGKQINCYKDMGLVSQVFNVEKLQDLKGKISIGHVRYSTTGSSDKVNAQPICEKFNEGQIAVAHNGNITNAEELKEKLKDQGAVFKTTSDSEVILKLLEMESHVEIKEKFINALKYLKGSYSLIFSIKDTLIAVRDPLGIRPLCIGKLNDNYVVSSESCALSSLKIQFIRDVNPGEMIIINNELVESVNIFNKKNYGLCSFEYIYFAREDSIIDGISVYESRINAGKKLYENHAIEGDIVVGVPDSGIPAAIGYSKTSGIPYGLGFIKNRYAVRSFILPHKNLRESMIDIKLNPLLNEVRGKKVIVIDDSIVRGTSSKKVVKILFENGAKEVHFRIASPPIKCCCHLGIDTGRNKELIAAAKSIEEIRKEIGATTLEYLSLEEFCELFDGKQNLCKGCFNGKYPQ